MEEKTVVNMDATAIVHSKGIQFPASRSPRDFNLTLIAMEEYASQQSASLKAENDRLREALIFLQKKASEILAYGDSRIGRDNLSAAVINAIATLSQPKEKTK